MSFKVVMMPAASAFLECARCLRRHFSLLEESAQVRLEATAKGWACNDATDEDFCSQCKEA